MQSLKLKNNSFIITKILEQENKYKFGIINDDIIRQVINNEKEILIKDFFQRLFKINNFCVIFEKIYKDIAMNLENITVYLNDKILLQKYSYFNNKLHGLYKSYWKNGKIKKSCEYDNDKLIGVYTEFYENSNLKKSCAYNNGKLNGVYKEFYENSNLKKSCEYNNGKLNGVYKEFYENSNLKIFCNYIDGNIIGAYKEFYSSANLKISCVYIKEGIHGEYYKYYDIDKNSNNIQELSYYIWGIILVYEKLIILDNLYRNYQ